MDVPLVRLAAACAVIALVLFGLRVATRAALRPWPARNDDARLVTLVEAVGVAEATAILVVRVAERYFALVRSGGQVGTICEVPPESIERYRRRDASPFARLRIPRA